MSGSRCPAELPLGPACSGEGDAITSCCDTQTKNPPVPAPECSAPIPIPISAPATTTTTTTGDQSLECQFPGLDHVTLVRRERTVTRRKYWTYAPGLRFEHNLHWAVGLLELANAGDFAANIWDQVPVPIYAIVFMAIGGCAAGISSVLALRDAARAWRNIRFLGRQQRLLKEERCRLAREAWPTHDIDVLLDVTRRERYNEIINRWGMDILMGGGAVLISVGTFLAIGGANRTVWYVSNILSGYLGNAPIALFGLVNFTWSMYMWARKLSHRRAATRRLSESTALSVVGAYCFHASLFFILSGPSAIIGGVMSMMTATHWWAYVFMIPVIICSYFSNTWWRIRVGYDRPPFSLPMTMDMGSIVRALEFAEETRRVIKKHPGAALAQLVPQPTSLPEVLESFVRHDMFEMFSLRVIKNKTLRSALAAVQENRADVDVAMLLELPDSLHTTVLAVADRVLQEKGAQHFEHRVRFLAEVLGTYLDLAGNHTPPPSSSSIEMQDIETGHAAPRLEPPQPSIHVSGQKN